MQATGLFYNVMAFLPCGFDCLNLFRRWIFQFIHFRFPVTSQHDIGTTSRHVGGDSNGSRITCIGDDFRFLCVEFGVQHIVFNTGFIQRIGKQFGFFNGDCTDQNRLVTCYTIFDVFNNGIEFVFFCFKHHISAIITNHRTIGRNDDGF